MSADSLSSGQTSAEAVRRSVGDYLALLTHSYAIALSDPCPPDDRLAFLSLHIFDADERLKNAAEQFVAAHKDGNVAELLDYFADIFTEALAP